MKNNNNLYEMFGISKDAFQKGKDHYQTVGVPRDATPEEIGDKFFPQAVRHKMKLIPETAENVGKFAELMIAFETISVLEKRKAYDKLLQSGQEAITSKVNYVA